MEWEAKQKNDTTLPAPQVGLGTVKACLRGHDDGVSRVDDGVKNTSLQFSKRERTALSECVTFSDFAGVECEIISET